MALEYLGNIDSPKSVVTKEYLDNAIGGLDETYIGKGAMGAVNGVATLGSDGRVPSSQLPSSLYVTHSEMEGDELVLASIISRIQVQVNNIDVVTSLSLGNAIKSIGDVRSFVSRNASAWDAKWDYNEDTIKGVKVNVAAKADQLSTPHTIWGQSFDGSANVSGALTGATTIEASTSVKIGSATISWDATNGCLKIDKGIYSESFVSAGGKSSTPPSGGGLDWTELTTAGTEVIHASHIPQLDIAKISNLATASVSYASDAAKLGGVAAASYATQSWVEGKGYTTNTGTVTSVAVKMNNTVKGTITTYGTIDLGTIITAHQDISGKQDKITESNKLAYSLISGTPTIPTKASWNYDDVYVKLTDSRLTDARKASDVYAWAKKSTLEASDVPSLAASKITSGTFDAARIPSLAISKITNLQTTLDGLRTITDSENAELATSANLTQMAQQLAANDIVTAQSVSSAMRLAAQARTEAHSLERFVLTMFPHGSNTLSLGNVQIAFDGANNAVKVQSYNGGAAGFYALGWVSAGGISTTSDITRKTVLDEVFIPVDKIAAAPSFAYKLKGQEDVQVGTSAQYWKDVVPDSVRGEEGNYSLAYGQLAMVSVISLAKEVRELKREIQQIKRHE